MPGPKPSARPRPSGGFNPGGMGMPSEHLDEAAMQQMMKQQALGQQQAQSSKPKPQHSAFGPLSLGEELIVQPIKEILAGFLSIFGMQPAEQDPELAAKQQQMHQRYEQLNQEQQQEVQNRYKAEMQRKQEMEEEAQRKRQQQEQQSQQIVMPASPQKGPKGPGGSKKQKATQQLQQSRQGLSGPSSVN